jgi:hypothetical protein
MSSHWTSLFCTLQYPKCVLYFNHILRLEICFSLIVRYQYQCNVVGPCKTKEKTRSNHIFWNRAGIGFMVYHKIGCSCTPIGQAHLKLRKIYPFARSFSIQNKGGPIKQIFTHLGLAQIKEKERIWGITSEILILESGWVPFEQSCRIYCQTVIKTLQVEYLTILQ